MIPATPEALGDEGLYFPQMILHSPAVINLYPNRNTNNVAGSKEQGMLAESCYFLDGDDSWVKLYRWEQIESPDSSAGQEL